MKYIKKIITMLCVMIISLNCMYGCGGKKYETDGYYYTMWSDSCSVVGLKDETMEVLYIPSHFKGKPVEGIGVQDGFFDKRSIDSDDLKKIYYPYTLDTSALYLGFYPKNSDENKNDDVHSFAKETFFINVKCKNIDDFLMNYYYQNKVLKRETESAYAYVTKKYFENRYGETMQYKQKMKEMWMEAEEAGYEAFIQMANVVYKFNYEEAPNEGYFFINNFEYGGLIEDTPYKPIKEGYGFAGWYKEPECVNKWDFSVDKLHEEEYDEEGNFVFEELNLYAKWARK